MIILLHADFKHISRKQISHQLERFFVSNLTFVCILNKGHIYLLKYGTEDDF